MQVKNQAIAELTAQIELPEEPRQLVCSYGTVALPAAVRDVLPGLTAIETAPAAYEALKAQCPAENSGLDMLAYMLLAALMTREKYRQAGIDNAIFLDTMRCFSRFVAEHKASFGTYGFDRGCWAYRQLAMTLFRIGELEYEYRAATQTIHLHIPTGARITLVDCQESLQRMQTFVRQHKAYDTPFPYQLHSWLLSPVLPHLLEPDSRILRFQRCFTITDWEPQNREFLQWVYGRTDIAYPDLPETTHLQRTMKQHLLRGGTIGSARGTLNGFS